MKLIAFILCVLLAGIANAELKIVTTTPDFADIARQIGKDRVDVHSVMKGPENIHNVMAKPTEMVHLNKADLFVHSGVAAEPWRYNLMVGARNPRIMDGKPGNVDMSSSIEIKDAPKGKIDRSMGDVHPYGNPHYTLNPQVAQRMAATLVKAMAQADPANAEFYKNNAIQFVKSMGEISHQIRQDFAPYDGLKVVTFHEAWEYFADAVPIDIVGTIEPEPGITPSAAQLLKTIELMKRENVRVVICETWDDAKLAQYVADKAGAKLVVLPDHVNGVPQARTYQELFLYDVQTLIETAQAAGVQPKPVPASQPSSTGDSDAH